MIVNYRDKASFQANLIINNNNLLTDSQVSELSNYCRNIGENSDIIDINLSPEIIDSIEITREGQVQKFLSGYKLNIETTIANSENIDISVAKSQQGFFQDFERLNPFSVIRKVLENITNPQSIKTLKNSVNDNPAVYNANNKDWNNKAHIVVPDKIKRPVAKHFYNSPFFKVMTEDTPVRRIAVIDVFKKNGMTLQTSGNKPDTPHGIFVLKLLEQFGGQDDIEIKTFNVKGIKERPCSFQPRSLLKALKKVREDNSFNYLNLSVYYPSNYVINGIEFCPDNLYQNRSEIIENLPQSLKNIIHEIEEIIKSGCEVYIAGGNKADKFNILSLAKGAHVIGGIDDSELKHFSQNSVIETKKRLPVFISADRSGVVDSDKYIIKMPFEIDLTKLSYSELSKRIAKSQDYIDLENLVNEMTQNGKYKLDINSLAYKFTSPVNKNLQEKIFDLEKYLQILANHFDKDVSENIFPQGTHCNMSFSQFFNMNDRTHVIIPRSKTTKIIKSISGTSFATPQALLEDLHLEKFVRNLIDKDTLKDIFRYLT